MKANNYNVSGQTEIINRVKNNNRVYELLESIEKAMDEIHYNNSTELLYEDTDGDYTVADGDTRDRDFYNSLCEWVTQNCNHLVTDSMIKFTQLKSK